jgi:hypothetical protein
MVSVFRSQPDTAAVIQEQAPLPGLFVRQFQPFFPPDPLHPLVVDLSAFIA